MSEGTRLVAGEAILTDVRTVAQSQEQILEVLVRQHARLVYRIAYAVLRSHHDAEDAAQETFIRVLRYGSKLASVDNPKTWLARIAWRVAIDRRKRHMGRGELALDDPESAIEEIASAEALADETLHGAQIGAASERLIAALPKKLREPLLLSALQELSPRDVATTLDISEAAVRSRVFRARQILRKKLSDYLG